MSGRSASIASADSSFFRATLPILSRPVDAREPETQRAPSDRQYALSAPFVFTNHTISADEEEPPEQQQPTAR